MNEVCAWTQDSDGIFQTDCGHSFELNEGGPVENQMKFCCYCGKGLIEELHIEED